MSETHPHISDLRWAGVAALFALTALLAYTALRLLSMPEPVGVPEGGIPYYWRCGESVVIAAIAAGGASVLPDSWHRHWLRWASWVTVLVVVVFAALMEVFP